MLDLDLWATREERIEALESRLRTVEKQHTHRSTPTGSGTIEDEHTSSLSSDATNLYEGDSSFTNQFAQASEAAKKTTPGAPGLDASLRHLRALLELSNKLEDHRFPRSRDLQSVSSVVPLPFTVVAAVLGRIKGMYCWHPFLKANVRRTHPNILLRLFPHRYINDRTAFSRDV